MWALEPMENVRALGEAVLASEEGRIALSMHDHLTTELAAHEATIVKEWHGVMATASEQNLKQPLIM